MPEPAKSKQSAGQQSAHERAKAELEEMELALAQGLPGDVAREDAPRAYAALRAVLEELRTLLAAQGQVIPGDNDEFLPREFVRESVERAVTLVAAVLEGGRAMSKPKREPQRGGRGKRNLHPAHGLYTTYNNHGCRCVACRKAWAKKMQETKIKRASACACEAKIEAAEARVLELENALNAVDMTLANRDALDGIPDRRGKILKAISTAKRADELKAGLDAALKRAEEMKVEADKWEGFHDADTSTLMMEQARDSYGPTEELDETAKRILAERDQLRAELAQVKQQLGVAQARLRDDRL